MHGRIAGGNRCHSDKELLLFALDAFCFLEIRRCIAVQRPASVAHTKKKKWAAVLQLRVAVLGAAEVWWASARRVRRAGFHVQARHDSRGPLSNAKLPGLRSVGADSRSTHGAAGDRSCALRPHIYLFILENKRLSREWRGETSARVPGGI